MRLTPPSPEIELLCLCASPDLPSTQQERIVELAGGGLDWPCLLGTADLHGMSPLLAWHMARLRPAGVPSSILERMHSDFQNRCLENMRLSAELARIVEALANRGVDAIAFKGPVHAMILYGNLGLRQFSDLDLLVRPQDFERAQDALRSLGMRPVIELDSAQHAAHLRNDCEMEFVSPANDTWVDVHWALTPRHYRLGAIQGMWQRTRTVSIGGAQVRTLASEDLLLVLSIHGHKHYWERLCWLCDIAALVRTQPRLNFDETLDHASAIGARLMVLLALRLASDILELPLPEHVQQEIRSKPELDRLAAMATRRMFAGRAVGDVARWRFVLAARERWTDKVLCAGRFLLTPTREDWQSLRLPRFLVSLYPAIRVARVAGRVLRVVPARRGFAKPLVPPTTNH